MKFRPPLATHFKLEVREMKTITILFFCLILFSCGSGDDSTNAPTPPTSSAPVTDSVGDTIGTASRISLNSAGTGSFSSRIDNSSDIDFFFIEIITSGNYIIEANVDQFNLIDSSGSSFASGNSNSNNRISFNLTPDTYFIRVRNNSSADYIITISRMATDDNSGLEGGNPGSQGVASWVLVWEYRNSEIVEGPDIDLYVRHPNGSLVHGANRSGNNELSLDFDDRGGFGSGNGGGPERIVLSDNPTTGVYVAGVRWYEGIAGSVRYRLTTYLGDREIATRSGTLNATPDTQRDDAEFIGVQEILIEN